jgi:tripartite-type tricarboxylate transporter receptor subunit TctC
MTERHVGQVLQVLRHLSPIAYHALCALAIVLMSGTASGQSYPSRPIRLIVPSLPGGGTDISARLIAPRLSETLGQQVVVENRAGAASIVGSEIVARAAPDGYTLLMGIATITINPSMHRKLPYDAERDFVPVSQVAIVPNVLVVHPSVPAKTVKDLIALARVRPGEITYASAGVGSNLHLSMELFLHMAGIKMVHVPYKGSGGAFVDLLSGQVSTMITTALSVAPHLRSRRLRGLGLTSAKRSPALPDIPTIAEVALPGYEAVQWYGVFATGGTPREIVSKLNAAVVRAVRDPAVKDRFAADGAEAVGNAPEEFAAIVHADIAKWAKLIKDAGIKSE